MKNRTFRRCTGVFLLICLVAAQAAAAASDDEIILPVSAMIASEMQHLPTGDFLQREKDNQLQLLNSDQAAVIYQAMEDYVAPESTLIKNQSDYYYYYENLESSAQKQMYDVMYQIALDPVTEGNYGLLLTETDPDSSEFGYDYFCAELALTYDHPELFWLYNSTETDIGYFSDGQLVNGRYTVFFGMMEPYDNYETQMNEFNAAVDSFLADIDRTKPEYDVAKQIHDKLIDLVTYDTPICDAGMDEYGNLGHTAYGALVKDSWGNANHAVCDGYSLAYEYLLQQCGIHAIFIGGEGGPTRLSMGGHAWNMINIDSVWYETDSTWDDAGTIENNLDPNEQGYDYFMNALKDPVYRELVQHFLFLISSDKMEHFIPEEGKYVYHFDDGSYISVVGECYHERMGADGLIGNTNPYGEVIQLAPRAAFDY